MITEAELDERLSRADLVGGAMLPALPESLLADITAGRFDAPPTGLASLLAAGQLAEDARVARLTDRRRRRRGPRRVLAVLAAAVLVAGVSWQVGSSVRPAPPAGPAVAPGSLQLVAAEPATFPVSFDPPPAGLTPEFSAWPAGPDLSAPVTYSAYYDGGASGVVVLTLYPDEPSDEDYTSPLDQPDLDVTTQTTVDVDVDGAEAELLAGDDQDGEAFATLLWERADGSWVRLEGDASYGDLDTVVDLGRSLVDVPQPVGLQLGLAPVGWSAHGYESSRSLDVVSDTDPTQLIRVSVLGDEVGSVDNAISDIPADGAVRDVTVQGQPARLVATAYGYGSPEYWTLTGRVADGPFFMLVAPRTLTPGQVVQMAEQVTTSG